MTGRVQHLRNLRTLSMRMRAMQHWSDAVSEVDSLLGRLQSGTDQV